MSDTFLQKYGEYPKLENSDNIVKLSSNAPYIFFTVNENRNNNYPILKFLNLISAQHPTPYVLFSINAKKNNNYPILSALNLVKLKEPVPFAIFYMPNNNKYPELSCHKIISVGAFNDATNLTNVTVSDSVKNIGDLAFNNTGITKISIASDCVYTETSMPPECIIIKRTVSNLK